MQSTSYSEHRLADTPRTAWHALPAGLYPSILYFFFNTIGLPLGLTYMSLLAPLLYFWVIKKRKKELLLPLLLLLLPFIVLHALEGDTDKQRYVIALLNIIAVYIFCQAFYTWLVTERQKEKIFSRLILLNTILCVIATGFYFTPYSDLFWIEQALTDNVSGFRRLKMFTYEASYYALLFVPLFLFYFIRYTLHLTGKRRAGLLFMLFLPLVLSFSIGVILCLLAAGFLTLLIHYASLHTRRRVVNGFITFGIGAIVVFAVTYVFFRDNPLFLRLENILAGRDTSSTGRTAEAFILAQKILAEHNSWWGIGPGQLSLAGDDIIRGYYLYHHTTPVAIPNAAAETLVLFGWTGFSLRFLLQLFLFWYTKVWTNYYRLLLFLFIFLFQFMGSYITNMAEYVIWILAFTNAFPALDVKHFSRRKKNRQVAQAPGATASSINCP